MYMRYQLLRVQLVSQAVKVKMKVSDVVADCHSQYVHVYIAYKNTV